MKTAIETGRDGLTPLRVYHRAGTVTVGGVQFEDSRFSWTHPADKAARLDCESCQRGTIPADVKSGKRRSG